MMTWNYPPIILLCWYTVRGVYTGVGWYWLPCCDITEPEWDLIQKCLDPPNPFLHWHIPKLSSSHMVENSSSATNVQGYVGGRYFSFDIWISTMIFRYMAFNVHLLWMEEGGFCSVTPFDQEENPCSYCLGEFISKFCFKAITSELRFTKNNNSYYVDQFWQIIQMVKVWNDQMTSILLYSREICLSESISIWHSRWTCLGWILCPRKPHPFENECHTDWCALYRILFIIELVKGKAHPRQAGPLEF